MKKIYIIWIWWIGISAIARYYNNLWYKIYWTDSTKSNLTQSLQNEGINISYINNNNNKLNKNFEKVIYSEAISQDNPDLILAKKLWLQIFSYPEILWLISNDKKLIAVAWTHGKSTTTSLISLILKNSKINFTSIVWTLLKEFNNSNYYSRTIDKYNDDYFVIESCEYKRSFLNYKPSVAIILNIEVDHLDYYKDWNDYLLAYKEFIDNVKTWWFVILNWNDLNCQKLIWIRKDINYIKVFWDYFEFNNEKIWFPTINLKIAGEHILFDAKIAYTLCHMIGIDDLNIITSLEKYEWVWRRMEEVWFTKNKNIIISDYGHHPTEIWLTLSAIKKDNPSKKILTIFQPHQYNRTIELLDWFKNCFNDTDLLIVPNIYESRDNENDKQNMNSEIFIQNINHNNKIDGKWFQNTIKIINEYDNNNFNNLVIILMWAWDIDDLRFDLIKW
jgi:UDP-N-acetylmuramate--alanine ligase